VAGGERKLNDRRGNAAALEVLLSLPIVLALARIQIRRKKLRKSVGNERYVLK